MIVLLSGGTGGAKLAAGLLDVLGDDRLAVIANTGDDIAAFGLHVSPDPDLVTYWLAGVIDEERGCRIAGETYRTFEQLVQLGAPDWFSVTATSPPASCAPSCSRGPPADGDRSISGGGFWRWRRRTAWCDEPVQTYVRAGGEVASSRST